MTFDNIHFIINKTKDTLVPSAARDFRAQGKDCRMLEIFYFKTSY